MDSERLAVKKTGCRLFAAVCSLILLPSIAVWSQSGGSQGEVLGAPLETKAMAEAENKIKDVQKNIDAVSAVVYQRKKNQLLKNEIATEGTIILKRPNLLHWEVKKPEPLTIIVDGKIMWVYHPDVKEAQKYILSEQFIARQTMEFFSSAMAMSLEEIGKRFDIAAYNPNDSLIFEMRPKSSMAAKYLTAIYIWYKDGEGVPYKFEVIDKNGNSTVTELRDIVLNPSINASAFHFDIPKGVTITNIENEGAGY
ncbi:MAG: outer membrane lipoprotein chaperone LolA [Deltaproteobacteria bacterium]|nr:outer membrane lipoprotein chaperone LolA [Deltaproteobacteria bacterium]MBI3755621.1 outer membrane lipoprotein chaperone LolA [Deltaproteobacteria bacterium]